jgi:hypothetical protein
MYAVNNAIYIVPEHRGLGVALLVYSERELVKRGARVALLNVKKVFDWGKVASALGYEATDTVYQKFIGGLNGTYS